MLKNSISLYRFLFLFYCLVQGTVAIQYGCYDTQSFTSSFHSVYSLKSQNNPSRDKMKYFDETDGRIHEDYWTKEYTTSGDNINSLTESTCISVESLEDGTFYEDDNDEFVATLSEMSDCHVEQNYSDDELLDEYCRESELRYQPGTIWMFLTG